MLNRKHFLKYRPSDNVAKSQLLTNDSKAIDDDAKTFQRKEEHTPQEKSSLDDSSKWATDDEETSNGTPSSRRRRKKLRDTKENTQLMVMRAIFKAQTDEVKEIVINLHKLHTKQMRANKEKQLAKSKPLIIKKKKKQQPVNGKNKKRTGKSVLTAAPRALQFNRKLLARLQRRRRHRGKPKSNKKCPKFPRRKGHAWSQKGNKQSRKRYIRSQKLFNKSIFIAGRKLFDEVWQTVKDPKSTATSFCNNNIHGLNKLHRKQIALYEKIEEDLHRLNIARHERAEAAIERQAKQQEKEHQRQHVKNKIEIREAARTERDALRKERRAARKKRALEKKIRKEETKADMIRCRE